MPQPARHAEPSIERRADELARAAAEQAVRLALADTERQTAIAVERAVRDANVQRDLDDHAEHLAQINGSQRAMAASLESLRKTLEKLAGTFERQTVAQETLVMAAERSGVRAFTRIQTLGIVVTAALATGGFLLAIVTALAHG